LKNFITINGNEAYKYFRGQFLCLAKDLIYHLCPDWGTYCDEQWRNFHSAAHCLSLKCLNLFTLAS